MRTLVIVEGSGKTAKLENSLRKLGIHAQVVATLGHICENPQSLENIALDESLRETAYTVRSDRVELLGRMRVMASEADRIYLATDDDQEGNVIAADVAAHLPGCESKLYRARLRALSEDELSKTFVAAAPTSLTALRADARQGDCRRVIDRAIGATFSELSTHFYAGRIQSALLSHIAATQVPYGDFTLTLDLEGKDYYCTLPVFSPGNAAAYEQLQAALDSVRLAGISAPVVEDVSVSSPWGFEDVLIAASERLGLDIETVEHGFQEAYERGRVSYPRARANAFSADAIGLGESLAAANRCQFVSGLLPVRNDVHHVDFPHESPRPLDEDLVLGRPLSLLDTPDAIAVLVARNFLLCGQKAKKRSVEVECGGNRLLFSRLENVPRKGWQDPPRKIGLQIFSRERALLRFMSERDLGRPSTVVGHIKKFLSRDLIAATDAVRLTDRGRLWEKKCAELGLTKEIAKQVENSIARLPYDKSAQDGACDILKAHALYEPVSRKIREQSAAQAQPQEVGLYGANG